MLSLCIQDEGFHDHAVTILLVAWGQFIDHDITLTAETKLPETKKQPKCCDGGPIHENCFPIDIPAHDHFYSEHKRKCMNFVRSQVWYILSNFKESFSIPTKEEVHKGKLLILFQLRYLFSLINIPTHPWSWSQKEEYVLCLFPGNLYKP